MKWNLDVQFLTRENRSRTLDRWTDKQLSADFKAAYYYVQYMPIPTL